MRVGASSFLIPIYARDRGEQVIVIHAHLGRDVGDGHLPVSGGRDVPPAYLVWPKPRDQSQRPQERDLILDLTRDDPDGDNGPLGRQSQPSPVVDVGADGDGIVHPKVVIARQLGPDQTRVPVHPPLSLVQAERHHRVGDQRAHQCRI